MIGVAAGRRLLACSLVLLLWGWSLPLLAADLYFFHSRSCPHCAQAALFLDDLRREQPTLRIEALEVTQDPEARALFLLVNARLGVAEPAVPLFVIGDQALQGFGGPEDSGGQIRRLLARCTQRACDDPVAELRRTPDAPVRLSLAQQLPERLALPFLGEVSLASLSLPLLTVVLAALDGFNPCAMWVLLFLLGLLSGLGGQRRAWQRVWLLGGVFLLASAFVYYLILAAWLNAFLWLGLVVWVRVGVALVAMLAGAWYVREYCRNPEMHCPVTAAPWRRRVLERLRQMALQDHFWLALVGVVLLAFAVNVVEFLCSAGIPAIFTQVLALSPLPFWQYQLYLLLYLAVFMLDDVLVFFLAARAMQWAATSGRYSRWSRLVGGVLLLLLGVMLLLRPDWLNFV